MVGCYGNHSITWQLRYREMPGRLPSSFVGLKMSCPHKPSQVVMMENPKAATKDWKGGKFRMTLLCGCSMT